MIPTIAEMLLFEVDTAIVGLRTQLIG